MATTGVIVVFETGLFRGLNESLAADLGIIGPGLLLLLRDGVATLDGVDGSRDLLLNGVTPPGVLEIPVDDVLDGVADLIGPDGVAVKGFAVLGVRGGGRRERRLVGALATGATVGEGIGTGLLSGEGGGIKERLLALKVDFWSTLAGARGFLAGVVVTREAGILGPGWAMETFCFCDFAFGICSSSSTSFFCAEHLQHVVLGS